MPRRAPDPAATRSSLLAVGPWIAGEEGATEPPRAVVAAAVRASLRTLEHAAPGHSVEVRVPPYGAVQCLEGPRHTRGTPPHVVETDAVTWLGLVLGRQDWDDALTAGRVQASGHRTDEIGRWLAVIVQPRTDDAH